MTTVGTIKIGVDATEARRGAEEAAAMAVEARVGEASVVDEAVELVEAVEVGRAVAEMEVVVKVGEVEVATLEAMAAMAMVMA